MVDDIDSLNAVEDKIAGAKKAVGLIEKSGCGCLNLGCLLLFVAILSVIALLTGFLQNPLDALSSFLDGIWGALS